MSICAILLAAGASSRMRGLDKLMQQVRGTSLLRDRAQMLRASVVDQLIIVLPDGLPDRHDALAGLDLHCVINSQAQTGMASSIQTGLRALPRTCDAALIMPADLPDLTLSDINTMLEHFAAEPDMIHRGVAQSGQPGSPVIFPRAYFAALNQLSGDESGRAVLAMHKDKIRAHALPDTHATLDLDTPEDWAAWRARPNPQA
ncbi:nucleotidyltransferase family protein [Litoreibacter sp.]|nr:nucleotidyltransferase family protein [Litoreibacter sp.]